MYQNSVVEKAPLKNLVMPVPGEICIWNSCISFLSLHFSLFPYFLCHDSPFIHLFIHSFINAYWAFSIYAMLDPKDRKIKICFSTSKSFLASIIFLVQGLCKIVPFLFITSRCLVTTQRFNFWLLASNNWFLNFVRYLWKSTSQKLSLAIS